MNAAATADAAVPSLHTPLCDLLGSRYPIVQTAMGWVARPELVAATCNEIGRAHV